MKELVNESKLIKSYLLSSSISENLSRNKSELRLESNPEPLPLSARALACCAINITENCVDNMQHVLANESNKQNLKF